MKKLFILISILMMISITAYGQGFGWGLKGGVSNSTVSLTVPGGDTFPTSTETKSGAVAGAFLNFDLVFLNLQIDALYAQKGYTTELLGQKTDITLNYLSIPAVAKFVLFPAVVKPYLAGGIEYSYLLDISTDIPGVVKEDFNSSDFGIVVAGGVDFGLQVLDLNVDVRYIYGLNNVAKTEGYELMNQTLEITLGLEF